MLAADLNGDGVPDLLITNQNANTFSVLLQDPGARGTFLPAANYATGQGPSGAAVADVNGDGLPDVVVPNLWAGTVQIFLQDPANPGVFQAPTTLTLGANPAFVVVGDFNKDGFPDLAVAMDTNSEVAILAQDATNPGHFLAPVSYPAGVPLEFLAVGDFNRDGWLDLAACGPDGGSSSVSVLLADSAHPGGFLAPVLYSTGLAPMSVVVADLDGDGKLDLAVSSRDANDVTVLLGKGDGTFHAGTAFPTQANAWDVQVADMNGDGRPDLVVAEWGTGSVFVLLQDPTHPGAFVPGPRFAVGGNPSWLSIADLDGDGKLDIAVANWGSADAQVLLADPVGQPTWLPAASMSVARSDLGAAVGSNGLIYAVGGRTPVSQSLAEAYDPAANSWTTLANMSTPRSGVVAVTGPDGRIYAIGGENGSGLASAEAYDTTTNVWVGVASMSVARISAAATVGLDGMIYVAGGYTGPPGAVQTCVPSVEAYDTAKDTWKTVASMRTARTAPAMATGIDGRLYVFGGLSSTGVIQSSVEAYDPGDRVTGVWVPVAPMPTARWVLAAASAPDGRIMVVGGENSAAAAAYDPSRDTWATLSPLSSVRRGDAAAKAPDGRVFAIGGHNGTNYLTTVEAYGPTVVLSPKSGGAGSTFAVTGSGFGKSANVAFYWGSAASGGFLGVGATDASGNLAPSMLSVPNGALPGTVRVTVIDSSSAYPVDAPFTVP